MMSATTRRPIGQTAVEVPQLGFGGAAIANLYEEVGSAQAIETLRAAYRAGLSFFDTAPLYGHGLSEHLHGEGLRDFPRDSLVVETKVGRVLVPIPSGTVDGGLFARVLPFATRYDYSAEGAMRSFEDSLQRLGMSHVDLLLIHAADPIVHGPGFPKVYRELMAGAYPAIKELRDQGVVSGIGFGINCAATARQFVDECDLDVVLLSGRYTLMDQSALDGFFETCERKSVSVVIGSPFNSGILANDASPTAKYDYKTPDPNTLEKIARIRTIAKRYDAELRSLALQFPLFQRCTVSVIPGMRSPLEVEQNIAAMNAAVPADLWAELKRERLIDERAPIARAATSRNPGAKIQGGIDE